MLVKFVFLSELKRMLCGLHRQLDRLLMAEEKANDPQVIVFSDVVEGVGTQCSFDVIDESHMLLDQLLHGTPIVLFGNRRATSLYQIGSHKEPSRVPCGAMNSSQHLVTITINTIQSFSVFCDA